MLLLLSDDLALELFGGNLGGDGGGGGEEADFGGTGGGGGGGRVDLLLLSDISAECVAMAVLLRQRPSGDSRRNSQ